MTVTTSSGTIGPVPVPGGGVVYVANGTCSTSYSPFTVTYPSTSGCGNAVVQERQLLGPAHDRRRERHHRGRRHHRTAQRSGLLGLVANNFVRVKHPCSNGTNGSGSISNLTIDAAILAIDHSFIVDHYDCGSSLGTLQVNGAIAQKFRGAVGTTGGTGYIKDYNYDDRLRYQEPPHFFDPVQSAWHVQRETLDFP